MKKQMVDKESNVLYIAVLEDGKMFKIGKSRSYKFDSRMKRISKNFASIKTVYKAGILNKKESSILEKRLLSAIPLEYIIKSDIVKNGGRFEFRDIKYLDKALDLFNKLDGWKDCKIECLKY